MAYIDETRQAQIAEAEQALVALGAQREAVMVRWRHFRTQLGFDDLPEPAKTDNQHRTTRIGEVLGLTKFCLRKPAQQPAV